MTYPRNKLVTITSYPLKKYIIYPRERTESHGTKPQYEVSGNSHTYHPHGEKDIQVYEDIE